jgi:hypothetical protein
MSGPPQERKERPERPGRRRADRVLAPDYLAGIESVELAELRRLRRDAVQEEADLSYVRRLLQGRVDIVRSELVRRASGAAYPRVADLPGALAGQDPPAASHPSRHLHAEPSSVAEPRREVEQVLADIDLADVTARTDEELQVAVDRLAEYEGEVSARRQRVQQVVDACNAEIARRYRDGEAQVGELLRSQRDVPPRP